MLDKTAQTFAATRDTVIKLVHSCPSVAEYPKDERKGIYLLFVNDFKDEKVLPIYVGKGTGAGGVQKRYIDHLQHLIALNRYSGKDYRRVLVERRTLDGRFMYAKMLKYITDCNLSLSDVSCVLLEECGVNEAPAHEREWIDKLHAAFFGFNQINSRTMPFISQSDTSEDYNAELINMIVDDLKCCEEYWDYGFTDFNFRYTLEMGNALAIDPDAWYDNKNTITAIRAKDSWGSTVYEVYRNRMYDICDNRREELSIPDDIPIDVQIYFLRMMISSDEEVRYARNTLLRCWREKLLPKNTEYDFCPMGDRFRPFAFPNPSSLQRTLQIRLELSGTTPRLLRRAKLRQQPEILRVDYRFLNNGGRATGLVGGTFVDCDLTRHLADPIVTYRLKAELIRGTLHDYGWSSWMMPDGMQLDEATQYLWRFSPALADGLWNDNGPSYGNEYERIVGINKHTLRGQELRTLGDFLKPVIETAVAARCRIEVFANAGATVTKKVLLMQLADGNVFVTDAEDYMRQGVPVAKMAFQKMIPRIRS